MSLEGRMTGGGSRVGDGSIEHMLSEQVTLEKNLSEVMSEPCEFLEKEYFRHGHGNYYRARLD